MAEEEAPSSPRSAALYYWGGNINVNVDINNNRNDFWKRYEDEKQGEVEDRFYWEEVTSASTTRKYHSPSWRRWYAKSGNGRRGDNRMFDGSTEEGGRRDEDGAEGEGGRSDSESIWNTSLKYRRRFQVGERRRIRFHLSIDDDDDEEEEGKDENGADRRSNARWLLVKPVPVAKREEEARVEEEKVRVEEEEEKEEEKEKEYKQEQVKNRERNEVPPVETTSSTLPMGMIPSTDNAALPDDDFAPPSEIYQAAFEAGGNINNDISIRDSVGDCNTANDGNVIDPPTADFTSLPIIDLSLPPATYARRIGEACRTTGFFYVVNHGIEVEAMEEVMDASAAFFDLDLEDKWKVRADFDGGSGGNSSKGYRGYFGIGMEDLENKDGTRDLRAEEGFKNYDRDDDDDDDDDDSENPTATKKKKGDFKEGFDCGLEEYDFVNNNAEVEDECITFFGENHWPDEDRHPSIRGFRNTLIRYQKKVLGLADKLLVAFAKSLNEGSNNGPDGDETTLLPEDYFVSRSAKPMCTLRLLHYPPNPHSKNGDNDNNNNSNNHSNGCGAHTDYGLFTILLQDSIGGLQVRNRSNNWIDAPPVPGSFVINVGDMLSHWTGGEYASTVHRVISPIAGTGTEEEGGGGDDAITAGGRERMMHETRGGGNGKHRYSVPFFFNPSHDAVVKPIRGDGSGLYAEGMTAGEGTEEVDKSSAVGNTCKRAVDILRERYEGTFRKKSKDKSS